MQFARLDAPFNELNVPGGQGSRSFRVAAPDVGQNPPAWHSVHCVCPAPSENEPAEQGVHSSGFPRRELNEPGEQAMQLALLVAPVEGKWWPGGHGKGTAVAAGQKNPAGHGPEQLGSVASAERPKKPAAQSKAQPSKLTPGPTIPTGGMYCAGWHCQSRGASARSVEPPWFR